MKDLIKTKIITSSIYGKFKVNLARLIAKLMNIFKVGYGDFMHYEFFDYWAAKGFFVIPNHFYQPIPDTKRLKKNLFRKKSQLIGISIDDDKQLEFLTQFSRFKREYNLFAHKPTEKDYEFHFKNLAFDGVDALVYYCMIRHFKPKNIIEVGSGWSSKIAAKAAIKNRDTKLTCIEPYPQEFMNKGYPGLSKLIVKDVQNIPINFFYRLKANDILFIDSSHTVKIGGDVNYLFLEILPGLKKGVLIHVHDIFFPFDYPREWVLKEHRFWNEQYLVQAFLMFNDSFEIIYANNYMGYKYLNKVKETFPKSPSFFGGSLWIRKIK